MAAYLLSLRLDNWAVARRLLVHAGLVVVGRPGHSVGVGLGESLLGKWRLCVERKMKQWRLGSRRGLRYRSRLRFRSVKGV